MEEQVNAADDLADFYLFAGLEAAQRRRLRDNAREYQLAGGEFLFEHGEKAERFFVLLSGHLKLIRLSPEGTEKVIEIINPGESFAEAIMFMPRWRYPLSAQAIQPSILLGFSNALFLAMLEESPDTAKRVLRNMSLRLRDWLNEIDNLTLQNATYRLVHYLLSRAAPGCRENCLVEFNVPKHVIASRLSIKPETLSRILNQLGNEGLLVTEGRRVRIASMEKLREYVYFDLD